MTEQETFNADAFLEIKVMEKNPLVIYHGKCADGFSAAWVFWHVSNRITDRNDEPVYNFDFHPGVYNEDPPDVSDRVVYLVDFSYKRKVVKDMIQIGGAKNIILIDHHKTAIEDLSNLSEELLEEAEIARKEIDNGYLSEEDAQEARDQFEMYTDLEMSGATLAWQYWVDQGVLTPEMRPVLLGHIEDRDLWRFRLPLTREIQANVLSYEYTFENWDTLMLKTSTLQLAEGGASIERKHMKDVKALVEVCQRLIIWNVSNKIKIEPGNMQGTVVEHYNVDAIKIPTASIPYRMASDAGHIMAAAHEEGKYFAACYYDTAEHRVFSLRSTENGMDVSLIAKEYGGGGHKHAAGFKVPRSHWLASV